MKKKPKLEYIEPPVYPSPIIHVVLNDQEEEKVKLRYGRGVTEPTQGVLARHYAFTDGADRIHILRVFYDFGEDLLWLSGVITHEVVHLMEDHWRELGDSPSEETRAYGIQYVYSYIMAWVEDRVKKSKL